VAATATGALSERPPTNHSLHGDYVQLMREPPFGNVDFGLADSPYVVRWVRTPGSTQAPQVGLWWCAWPASWKASRPEAPRPSFSRCSSCESLDYWLGK